MTFCPHCGKELDKNYQFCPHCGKSISWGDTTTQPNQNIPLNSKAIPNTTLPTEPKKQWIKGLDNKILIIGAIIVVVLIIGFLNGTSPSQSTTTKPAIFRVDSIGATKTELPVGTNYLFGITATISNVGDEDGTYTIEVKAGSADASTVVQTDSITIPAHQSKDWDGAETLYNKNSGTGKIWIGTFTDKYVTVSSYPIYDPDTIFDDYDANEVAADEKYKEKKFFVEGEINDMGKVAFSDYPYITIESGSVWNDVQCEFDKSYTNQIAQLRKGQEVIVLGTCQGKILINVYLKGCSFYSISP